MICLVFLLLLLDVAFFNSLWLFDELFFSSHEIVEQDEILFAPAIYLSWHVCQRRGAMGIRSLVFLAR
jgi:hypothetical protein